MGCNGSCELGGCEASSVPVWPAWGVCGRWARDTACPHGPARATRLRARVHTAAPGHGGHAFQECSGCPEADADRVLRRSCASSTVAALPVNGACVRCDLTHSPPRPAEVGAPAVPVCRLRLRARAVGGTGVACQGPCVPSPGAGACGCSLHRADPAPPPPASSGPREEEATAGPRRGSCDQHPSPRAGHPLPCYYMPHLLIRVSDLHDKQLNHYLSLWSFSTEVGGLRRHVTHKGFTLGGQVLAVSPHPCTPNPIAPGQSTVDGPEAPLPGKS